MGYAGAYGPPQRAEFSPTVWRSDQENFINNGSSTLTVTGASGGVAAADNKGFASIFRVSRPLKVSGFEFGQTTKLSGAGAGIDINAGMFTATTDGSGNWSPLALVAGMEAIFNIAITTANEINHVTTFAGGAVVLPPADYMLTGCYRFLNTVSGGVFKTVVGMRGNISGEPMPEGRWDMNTAAVVTYTTGTLAALFASSSWVSVATGSMANINWALRCEQ